MNTQMNPILNQLGPLDPVDPLVPLHVKNLRKRRPDFELNAHFSVDVKERVALLGKSGSGKSTLLRLIAGLEPLIPETDQGDIFLGQKNLNQVPIARREIGFVFQESALFLGLSVLENVTFGLRVRNVLRHEREKLALSWLERVDLQSKLHKSVTELSGGEKQRVAFIRAVIWQPRLLLLDEPFSALDPLMRKTLQKELIDLHQLWPAPMLFVTHDESDLSSIATRRLYMQWSGGSAHRSVSEAKMG